MGRPLPNLNGERVLLRLATEKDVPQIISFYRDNAAHFETVASPKPTSFYTVRESLSLPAVMRNWNKREHWEPQKPSTTGRFPITISVCIM